MMQGILLCLVAFIGWEAWRFWHYPPRPDLTLRVDAPPRFPADTPKVSFLVPAWNATEDLAAFVEHFRNLSLPSKELLLCIGGNGGTLLESWGTDDVIVLPQLPGEGKQRALQKCWNASSGDIIYLSDVDCLLTDRVVANLIYPLITGTAAVTTGPTRSFPGDLLTPSARARCAIDLACVPTVMKIGEGLVGCNTAITRDALEMAGAFQVSAPSGTDYTLAQELRTRSIPLWYVPGSPIMTRYHHTFRQYVRQQRRWLRNIFLLGNRYRVRRDVGGATLAMGLAYAAAGSVLGGIWWPPAWALIVVFGAHSVGNRLISQRSAGFHVTVLGAFQEFFAEQLAAIEVSADLLSGRTPW